MRVLRIELIGTRAIFEGDLLACQSVVSDGVFLSKRTLTEGIVASLLLIKDVGCCSGYTGVLLLE